MKPYLVSSALLRIAILSIWYEKYQIIIYFLRFGAMLVFEGALESSDNEAVLLAFATSLKLNI